MGKQPQHSNKAKHARTTVRRTKNTATYTIKGARLSVQVMDGSLTDAVAEHAESQGYIVGSVVNLNGTRYKLAHDYMGDATLVVLGGAL